MTATVTTLRERPVPEIVMIPLTQLVADDNIRDSLGTKESLQELAESIRRHGILEPLLVSWIEPPEGWKGEPGYRIAAGHRRYEAAKLAKTEFAPCIVREMTDVERLQVQLIENLKRKDLDPIEEAKAFAKAITLGMTKKDLAKEIAMPESTVADRIALLELPPAALEEIRKGKLGLEEAKQLLKLRKLKTFTREVDGLLKRGNHIQTYTVDGIIKRYERKDKADKLAEDAKAKGYQVFRATSSYTNPKGATFLSKLSIEGKEATKHSRQKCHAIVVVNDGYSTPTTAPACTNPTRHGEDGDSSIKIPAKQIERSLNRGERVPGMSDEDVIARKERKAERERRHNAFIAEQIRATPKADKVAGIIHYLADVMRPDERQVEIFATDVGLEPGMVWDVKATKLREFFAKSANNQILLGYAEAFVRKLPQYHEVDKLMWLVERGYEPDEEEAPIVAKVQAEAAAREGRWAAVPADLRTKVEELGKAVEAYYEDSNGFDDDLENILENNEGEDLVAALQAMYEVTSTQLEEDRRLDAEEAAEELPPAREIVNAGAKNAALADVDDEEGGDDEEGAME